MKHQYILAGFKQKRYSTLKKNQFVLSRHSLENEFSEKDKSLHKHAYIHSSRQQRSPGICP